MVLNMILFYYAKHIYIQNHTLLRLHDVIVSFYSAIEIGNSILLIRIYLEYLPLPSAQKRDFWPLSSAKTCLWLTTRTTVVFVSVWLNFRWVSPWLSFSQGIDFREFTTLNSFSTPLRGTLSPAFSILQPRIVFVKDPGTIPLKRNHVNHRGR